MTLLCYGIVLNEGRGSLGGGGGGYFNEASRENKQWASVHMYVVCMCVFMHRTNDCIVTVLDYHTHTHTLSHVHTHTCTHAHTSITHTPNIVV